MRNFLNKYKKSESGAVAVEFILVILPCLILMFLFLNVLMIVGNLMLTQAVSDRTVQQVAAYGCLPLGLKIKIEDEQNYLGVSDLEIRASRSSGTWKDGLNKDDLEASKNDISGNLRGCEKANRAAREEYVYVNINYTQDVVLIPGVQSMPLEASSLSIASNLNK